METVYSSETLVNFYKPTLRHIPEDNIFTCMSDYILVVGFIEHLQILTTSKYTAIANSHIPQFTTIRIILRSLLCLL
jgi:hypothetical protein